MTDLKEVWFNLGQRYSNDPLLINVYWEEIESAYSDSKRYYHDLSHIKYMIKMALEFKDQINNFDVFLFSVFYHDIIYNSSKNDNEEKSAQTAEKRLTSLGVPTTVIEKCTQQIRATKSHGDSNNPDTALLLDFDLGVLSEPKEAYDQYAQNVRKEYSQYPNILYRPGRKKVLKHFLNMPRIYKTEAFFQQREEQARLNLERELNSL